MKVWRNTLKSFGTKKVESRKSWMTSPHFLVWRSVETSVEMQKSVEIGVEKKCGKVWRNVWGMCGECVEK